MPLLSRSSELLAEASRAVPIALCQGRLELAASVLRAGRVDRSRARPKRLPYRTRPSNDEVRRGARYQSGS